MSSPSDLMGSGNSGIGLSTDYFEGSPNLSAQNFGNVKPISSPEVNPAYKGNYGRKAALMGNWRNPIQGQGTFFTQDEAEPFHLQSDKGANFAQPGEGE